MNKKNLIATTCAFILCACTHQGLSRQEQILNLEADKIPPKTQAAYFQCEFIRHATDCREAVWKTHPNPKPETGLDREFVMQRFIPEMNRRGAGVVLEQNGIKCGTVQEAHDMFWQHGYAVSCQGGQQYIIDRVNDEWRISPQPAKE